VSQAPVITGGGAAKVHRASSVSPARSGEWRESRAIRQINFLYKSV
jgi:hypothetical protein